MDTASVTDIAEFPANFRQSQGPAHQETLERLFRRIGELSALPSVAQRVVRVASDRQADARDLVQVVEQDPTLAIRILRSVNSSHYGLRSQVTDLQSAIALLGFDEVRNLALTVYVARLSDGGEPYRCFSRANLWKHMVATAVLARMIAATCHRGNPEEAYVVGLLHDVGLLLMEQYLQRQFRQIIDDACDRCTLVKAEFRTLTFDHTDLSAYVAWQSGLSESMCTAIAYHHAPEACRGRDRELLHVLVAANYFAARHGYPALGVATAPRPSDETMRGLGLREPELAAIAAQLADALAAADALANI
jgi:HD-like signal output (HDOD) protein